VIKRTAQKNGDSGKKDRRKGPSPKRSDQNLWQAEDLKSKTKCTSG